MIFLGFLIVTNKLKSDTKSTIINLDKADIRMMMVTGVIF
jgi:magnesium-transporting ATPase (P-type)